MAYLLAPRKPKSQHSRTLQLFVFNFLISQLDAKHAEADAQENEVPQEQYIILFESFLLLLKAANNCVVCVPLCSYLLLLYSQYPFYRPMTLKTSISKEFNPKSWSA